MLFRLATSSLALAVTVSGVAAAQAALTDVEMAHVAVTASNIDIGYAKLALQKSKNAEVRNFAETMIRDHSAVNQQVADLAKKLGVTAKDNAMSQSLLAGSVAKMKELRKLKGVAFDRSYAMNEVAYHTTVNGAVAESFIPNAKNPEVKAAFVAALEIFRAHQKHAEMMSGALTVASAKGGM